MRKTVAALLVTTLACGFVSTTNQRPANAAPLTGAQWTQIIVGGGIAAYLGIRYSVDVRHAQGAMAEAQTAFITPVPVNNTVGPAPIALIAERETFINKFYPAIAPGAPALDSRLRGYFEDLRVCWNAATVAPAAPSSNTTTGNGANPNPNAAQNGSQNADSGNQKAGKSSKARPGSNKKLLAYSLTRLPNLDHAMAYAPAFSDDPILKPDFDALSQAINAKRLADLSDAREAQLMLVPGIHSEALQATAHAAHNAALDAASTVQAAKDKIKNDAQAASDAADPQSPGCNKLLTDMANPDLKTTNPYIVGIDQTDLANAFTSPSLYQEILNERVGSVKGDNTIRAQFLIAAAEWFLNSLPKPKPALDALDILSANSGTTDSDIQGAIKNCGTAFSPMDCLTSLQSVETDAAQAQTAAFACAFAKNALMPRFTDISTMALPAKLDDIGVYDFGAGPGC